MLIPFSQVKKLISICHNIEVKKIFHVGAHIGEEAVYYHEADVAEIIWFEANQSLLPLLSSNINKFNLKQVIIPYALWNYNTSLDFHITNNYQSSSFLELQEHLKYYPGIIVTETRKINAYRLDSLIDLKPSILPWSDFDFINIDTQGAELAILQGLGDYIKQGSIKGIYLEVNQEPLYKNIPMVHEIDQFLTQFCFFRILTKWTQEGWGDALYLKSATN
jgi:FkbM family methyltransferase